MSMEGRQRFAYETEEGTATHLRIGRTVLRLSQEELAEKLGVNAATIGRRENGDHIPDNAWARAYLLEQLAELGCDRDLLGLPPNSSLALAEDQPVGPDLLRAYYQAEAERLGRAPFESPQSNGDKD